MEKIEKKHQKKPRDFRKKAAVSAAVLLMTAIAVIFATVRFSSDDGGNTENEPVITYGKITDKTADEVQELNVTLRDGTSWTIRRNGDSMYVLDSEGNEEYPVGNGWEATLLECVSTIDYLDVLSDDFGEFAENAADFGLDVPKVTVRVTYTDETQVKMIIGDSTGLEDNSVFMLIDGDKRLFSTDRDRMSALNHKKEMFFHVTQPVIHKARINKLEIKKPDEETICLEMDSEITASDAGDRWQVTSPLTYPADGEKMGNLLSNAANLRLGSFVGCVDEMSLQQKESCGIDAPAMVLTLHMDEGSIGNPDATGAYTVTDYGESTVTFAVGKPVSDVLDYVAFDGNVYMMNHFTLDVFANVDAYDMLSRYPVVVAQDTLQEMRIETEEETWDYVLTRTEKSEENEEYVTVTRNGEDVPYAAFDKAYTQLALTTVSGMLPADWHTDEEPHTKYTFKNDRNEIHTIWLTTFDALHDAVTVDGNTVFYIIKGGLKFQLQ